MSQQQAIYNVPVLIDSDYRRHIGYADITDGGSINIQLRGPLGEEFRRQLLVDFIKSLSVSYEYKKAVPSAPVRETICHVVDGVDGLTPDMLRKPEEKKTTWPDIGVALEAILKQRRN